MHPLRQCGSWVSPGVRRPGWEGSCPVPCCLDPDAGDRTPTVASAVRKQSSHMGNPIQGSLRARESKVREPVRMKRGQSRLKWASGRRGLKTGACSSTLGLSTEATACGNRIDLKGRKQARPQYPSACGCVNGHSHMMMIFTAQLPLHMYFQGLRPCDVFLFPFWMLLGDPRSHLTSEKADYFLLHSGLQYPTGAHSCPCGPEASSKLKGSVHSQAHFLLCV